MLKWIRCNLRRPIASCARTGVFLHVVRYASSQAIKADVGVEGKASPPRLHSKIEWSLQDDDLVRKLLSEKKQLARFMHSSHGAHTVHVQSEFRCSYLHVADMIGLNRRLQY